MAADHRARRLLARLEERVEGLHHLLDEREKQVNIAFTAAQKATDAALAAQQGVNAAQNEFRGMVKDQQATLASRIELEGVIEKVARLDNMAAGMGGRAGGSGAVWDWVLRIATLAIALAAVLFALRT